MNTITRFYAWLDAQEYRDFKYCDHVDLVAEFDPEAEVSYVMRQFGTCPTYDCLTEILFPDGSCLVVNYKGETEHVS